MECKIRKWKIDDAAELAATLNNKKHSGQPSGRSALSLH